MAGVFSILYVQFPVRPARWGKDSMLQCIPIRMVNVCALTIISPQLAFHFSVDENNRRRCNACHEKPVYHISDMTRNIKDFPRSAYMLPSPKHPNRSTQLHSRQTCEESQTPRLLERFRGRWTVNLNRAKNHNFW